MTVVNLKRKTVKIERLKINYVQVGEGRKILIIPGWKSLSQTWGEVASLLAEKGFSVFVPDLPGFGRSSRPNKAWGLDDYIEFILKFSQELKMGRFSLIGHSFGGQLAIKLAASNPDKIERLILCAPAALRNKKRIKDRVFKILAKGGKIFFSLPLLKLGKEKMRKILYFLAREQDYLMSGELKETMKKVISEDTREYFSRVKTPTLIIWGEKDKMISVTHAYILKGEIPKASLKIFIGEGHNFPYEKPKGFVKAVRPFLEE